MTGGGAGDPGREGRIARLIRGVQDVYIAPFAAVAARFAHRPTVPLAVLSASALAALAIPFVVGSLLTERRSAVTEPEGTHPPTATAPATATPAPSPTDATLSDRFGFAREGGLSGLSVRPETGPGGFELPTRPYRFSECGCAVSPDGTRIAYWAGSELRVVQVARPGPETVIYNVPAGQRGSGVAWSSDGQGILFALENVDPPGGPPGCPSGASLLVIEAGGGAARTLATDGCVYVPLGWDRAAGVAAAGETGEGGYMFGYLTVRTSGDPTPRRTGMTGQILMFSVEVSTDQRFVLGLFSDEAGSTLRWWRLDDPGTMVTGPRLGHGMAAMWRPLTSQIAWIEGGEVRLLDAETGVTSGGGSLPPGDHRLATFRVDGSAIAASAGGRYVLMEIASGRSATLSAGNIVGAVRFR